MIPPSIGFLVAGLFFMFIAYLFNYDGGYVIFQAIGTILTAAGLFGLTCGLTDIFLDWLKRKRLGL